MLIDTHFIITLNFQINNQQAIFLLASYLEAKEELASITYHVPFIKDFLIWHKDNNLLEITQDSVNQYVGTVLNNKTKSYVEVICSYIRSFCRYLSDKGIITSITIDSRSIGVERDPNKPRKIYNYYKYLGVKNTADLEEIKKAYHNKVRELHPDLNPDNVLATSRVSTLNRVYAVLKDELEKLAYDVTMGYVEYEDYMDYIEDISWHDKKYYVIWD